MAYLSAWWFLLVVGVLTTTFHRHPLVTRVVVDAFQHHQTINNKRNKRGNDFSFTHPHPRHVVSPIAIAGSDEFINLPQAAEQQILNNGVFVSDPSDNRYAASDWLQNMRSIPRSTVLKAVRGPVVAIVAWSSLVSIVHRVAMVRGWTRFATSLCLSSRPHSFLVSALGLLLVFRTNTAYQRFAEGRQIWERIHSESRNLSRFAILYENELGSARLKRVLRLLAAFPYLLHQHVQPQSDLDAAGKPYGLALPDLRGFHKKRRRSKVRRKDVMMRFRLKNMRIISSKKNKKKYKIQRREKLSPRGKFHWVDCRSLPWCLLPRRALDLCVHSSNRPLWVCDRLGMEAAQVPYNDQFSSRERLQFLSQIGKLSQAIGQCERIHQTAVPLNYARHSLRSLTLWLFTLPFALVGDFGLLTGPVMGLAAWLLYGIYQVREVGRSVMLQTFYIFDIFISPLSSF